MEQLDLLVRQGLQEIPVQLVALALLDLKGLSGLKGRAVQLALTVQPVRLGLLEARAQLAQSDLLDLRVRPVHKARQAQLDLLDSKARQVYKGLQGLQDLRADHKHRLWCWQTRQSTTVQCPLWN